MSLILHAGAEPMTYDGLRQLVTPEGTSTHVPIAHHRIIDVVKHSLSFYGHEVTEEQHGVTPDGARYFGVLMLKSAYGDYTDMLGLRNSHDKSMPVGLAFGSRVFVCDNTAFVAESVVMRKHTLRAKHDLPALISELVEPLGIQREAQARTIERFKHTALTDMMADHAVMQLYRRDVLNIQRVPEVLQQWQSPKHEEWIRGSAWHLFNAVTFALNGRIVETPKLTTQLHEVIDGVCSIQ